MKKLPIGIHDFEKLISGNNYYVDKTPFVHELTRTGGYYFLSRPRRFGKSLFLSTIKAAYEGKRELFRGLYLEKHWTWEKKHPVLHISFGSGVVRDVHELRQSFLYFLNEYAKKYDMIYSYEDLKNCFAELIHTLYKKYGQRVVILVDEYDKPILDNIEKSETALSIREELKSLYSVIKDSDAYIEFVLITGVSKFSKVSLFSGLNNLEDITLVSFYSSICGYTQQELQVVFADRLREVNLEDVRLWYNGYSWLGEKVYNPFDVLLYLKSLDFRPYWFETGTPTFLIRLLREGRYNICQIENLSAGEEIVGSFDIESMTAETLLFQAGYLTLRGFEQTGAFRRYALGYPNLEVKASLTNSFLSELTLDRVAKTRNQSALLDALVNTDLDGLKMIFHAFFSSIPHDWYRRNRLAGYEGYYASIFYCYFAALGLDVTPEDVTSHGQVDLTVKFDDKVFLFEFKVRESGKAGTDALDQIKLRHYSNKYRGRAARIYLIGIEFDPNERNIVRYEWETA